MFNSRTTTGLLILVVLACFGFVLLYTPQILIEQYKAVAELGPVWTYAYFAAVGLGAAILLGITGWIVWRLWSRMVLKKRRQEQRGKNPSQLTSEERDKEVQENLAAVEELQQDPDVADELKREIGPLVEQIEEKRESQRLEIVAFGSISSGKSSLLNALAGRTVFSTDLKGGTTVRRGEVPWPGVDEVALVDTPGLGEVDGAERQEMAARTAKDADLVLVVVDGPLRHSEFELLDQLGRMEKRVLICLNKVDWYEDQDRDELLAQIREQAHDFIRAEDVVAVRAKPAMRTRVRVLADGSETEEQVPVEPDISALAERMMNVVRQDGPDLLLGNLLLQSRGLVDDARRRVQDALDARAWKIVDIHMWSAGGAAALSPLPIIDLLSGCAISTKMVVDLARVYRQDVDLEIAVNLLGQLGKQLIAILGVSAATPAVTAVFASMLKTVPGVGTIAGGVLQGLVQAIVTRWIGAVFIQYFKNEMQQPAGGMASMARREWEKITSLSELHKMVQTARKRLLDDDEEADQ